MSRDINEGRLSGVSLKIALPIIVAIGVLLFVLTYLGIQKSRGDSLELLERQGIALAEALTLSADNAIKANSFFDLLVREKFSDMTSFLSARPDFDYSDEELDDFTASYGADAIIIFDPELKTVSYGIRGAFIDIDKILDDTYEVLEFFQNDSTEFNDLETVYGDLPGQVTMYYLEKLDDHKHIILIAADALFYTESKKSIGIGYLVQNIGRELGIEYIFYQTPDGIVFSSRKLDPVLKIGKDPFLQTALESDTTIVRQLEFGDREVLELARAFHSSEYGNGVFRLGLSLEKYYAIISGFDRQMITLSIVIFSVIVLFVLYWQGKQKRFLLDRSMQRIQTLAEMVFESINSALVVVKSDGSVEMVNHSFCSLFGTTEADMINTFWGRLNFAGVIPFDKVLSGDISGDEYETEFDRQGEPRNILVNVAPLYNRRRQIFGAVAIIYDYTEIKELEEAGRRKERLSELGDLAAGVAHEIRNPLNAISIAAQRLLAEFSPTSDKEQFESFTRQIKSEAGRLNEIVTRFLSLARGDAQPQSKFNAGEIISDTIQLIRPEIESMGVTIESTIRDSINLSGAPDKLKQLVINLLRNAADACPKSKGRINVELKKQDAVAVFSVHDNGDGIPEELKKKVFNPYFTTRKDGTGLGLSIVHNIVEEFKAEINIVTPSGGGTEFVIKFPQ